MFTSQGSLVRVQYRPPSKPMKRNLIPGKGYEKTQEPVVAANLKARFGRAFDQQGFIYFLPAPDYEKIKIGFTSRPEIRIANANTWFSEDVDWEGLFPGTLADEAAMHTRFKHLHLGKEWYRLTPELYDFLEGLLEAQILMNGEHHGDINANEVPINELLPTPPIHEER